MSNNTKHLEIAMDAYLAKRKLGQDVFFGLGKSVDTKTHDALLKTHNLHQEPNIGRRYIAKSSRQGVPETMATAHQNLTKIGFKQQHDTPLYRSWQHPSGHKVAINYRDGEAAHHGPSSSGLDK
jgi:hypothetical protein